MATIEPLWEHQKYSIEFSKGLPEFGFFHDMGTGKTRTTIEVIRDKFTKDQRLLRTLIIGPGVIIENWRREILKYSKIQNHQIVLLQGTGKQRFAKLVRECSPPLGAPNKIVVMNFQTLLMEDVFIALQDWAPEVIICDESQRIKNPQAKTTKALIKLSSSSRFRYILTGTPVLQNLLDLYSQFRFLDQGETFGTNFFVFRNTYFYDKNASMPQGRHFPDWKIKPGAEKEILAKISKKTTVARKSECLTLPPLVRKIIYVDLSPQQKKLYEEMRKDFITFLGDRAATATLAITKALRLQQIVSGFIKMEDGGEVKLKENPRQDALKEILEDLAPYHKVIVWACFRENYQQIREVCEGLGLTTRELHGDVSNRERQKAVDDFNTDESVRVFIGNQGAAGIGINLTSSDYSVYYSRNFSLEHDLQSEARNYRGGSEIHKKVTRIDLVAQGTIDEQILEALANKFEISENVLREIKNKI